MRNNQPQNNPSRIGNSASEISKSTSQPSKKYMTLGRKRKISTVMTLGAGLFYCQNAQCRKETEEAKAVKDDYGFKFCSNQCSDFINRKS